MLIYVSIKSPEAIHELLLIEFDFFPFSSENDIDYNFG